MEVDMQCMEILDMKKEEILSLDPKCVGWVMTPDEVIHIAKMLGALWQYDYEAARRGKVGMHAILKSKRHSDQFFVSRILLQHENILEIMADQIVMRLTSMSVPKPDVVIGIPDGATRLGEKVAEIFGARHAKMVKNERKELVLDDIVAQHESVLFVEDFCTKGTGLKEAVKVVYDWAYENRCPYASHVFEGPKFIKVDPVIMNRGGLSHVTVEGVGDFVVAPAVEYRVNDWGEECPLCKTGSVPIKPKESDENWEAISASQL